MLIRHQKYQLKKKNAQNEVISAHFIDENKLNFFRKIFFAFSYECLIKKILFLGYIFKVEF